MSGKKYIVVGGDAAGMSAASRIRKRDPESQVTVYEAGSYVSYSACGMPFHIGGTVKEFKSLIHYDVEKFRNERKIDVRLNSRVNSIDPENRKILYSNNGKDGEDAYDVLVIATGARPRIPENLRASSNVYTLRTLNDLPGFEEKVSKSDHITIVGAGYIGLELSEAFRERGKEVRIIQHSSKILRGYDSELSSILVAELKSNGVQLDLSTEIESVTDEGNKTLVRTSTGASFYTDMIVVAVGVIPNSELAMAAGIKTGIAGAIKVDRYMQTNVAGIYAAGDVSTTYNRITGKDVYMPLATGSNKSGRVAGENAAGGHREYGGIVGTEVVKVFSLEVGRTGLDEDEARTNGYQPVASTITSTSRSSYYPGSSKITIKMIGDEKTGRILGAQMIGHEGVAKRIDVVAASLYASLTVEDMLNVDYSYSPPFAPTWEPILVTADVLMGKMGR